MSLRERMHRTDARAWERGRYEKYGVIDNPFPAAGQPSGHPRMEDEIDDEMEHRVRRFETGARASQVLVVEGIQGVGKTNLLNYYEQQFREYYGEDEAFCIIRYYPDPEPSFDSVLRKIFQSLDQSHFEKIGSALADRDGDARDARGARDEAKSGSEPRSSDRAEQSGARRPRWREAAGMRATRIGVVRWIEDPEAAS